MNVLNGNFIQKVSKIKHQMPSFNIIFSRINTLKTVSNDICEIKPHLSLCVNNQVVFYALTNKTHSCKKVLTPYRSIMTHLIITSSTQTHNHSWKQIKCNGITGLDM